MRSETQKKSSAGRVALIASFTFHLLLLIGLASLQVSEHIQTEGGIAAELIQPEKRSLAPAARRLKMRKEAERPKFRKENIAGASLHAPTLARPTPSPSRPMTLRTDAALPDAKSSEFQLSTLSADVNETPSGTRAASRGAADSGRGDGAGRRLGTGTGSGLGQLVHSDGLSDEEGGIEAPKSPLRMIAEEMIKKSDGDGPVDVVFLLDISRSMQDNIYAVARRLEEMASVLERGSLDFQIGIATFHTRQPLMKESVKFMKLTSNVEKVRKELRKVVCSGGEKGLNAIMKSIEQVKFREGSSRRFVFVTDEAAGGDYKGAAVMGALYRARITVDVIGIDEPFQRRLAAQTGGIWIPIKNLSL